MMKEIYIIDRIEGKFVICENYEGYTYDINVDNIIGNFKEGDVLIKDKNFFKVDMEITKKRKEEIERIMKNMWK